jgi:hypothetical protein
MIMEDAVDLALTLDGVADDKLAGRLYEIGAAVRRMQVLISTAITLNAQALWVASRCFPLKSAVTGNPEGLLSGTPIAIADVPDEESIIQLRA